MYAPNHQQGHGSRLNGMPGGRGMLPQLMGANYYNPASSHQGPHTHPQAQHHSLQQDHSSHGGASSSVHSSNVHSTVLSSGMLSNVTPFTPSNHQNGHAPGSRGGQNQHFSEHWTEQLKSYKESERAHQTMTEQHQPHYFARLRASENKGIGPALPCAGNELDEEDRNRPINVEKALDRQDWTSLDFSGQGLRNLSVTLFNHYAFLTELYLASNNLSHLPAQIGRLRQLRHLNISNNQLTELPPELGMCTPLRELLVFNNSIQTLPFELGALYHLEMLGIQGNPLNSEMKQKLVDEGTKSLIASLKEQAPVPLPPQPRLPITIQEEPSAEKERIRVLSWNTLCEKYATATQYGYTPAGALSWDYRRESIMQEFRERDSDILCLQETAMEAFESFFSPELAKMGYKGVFYPKTRVNHLPVKDQKTVDGCSIFFKSNKYILLDKQMVDFRQTAINRPDMKSADDVFNRVMPKDTIAVFCFFESRYTGNRFIFVNAHLCWESFLADVKVVQTGILMDLVTKQSEKYTRRPTLSADDKRLPAALMEDDKEYPDPLPSQEYRNNTDIPLFLCGDYNSMPESSVYELLEKGRIPPDHPDLVGYSYGNFTRDGIEHPFSLRDSYAALFNTPEQVQFTNYTPTFHGILDYVWYTNNTLDCIELLGPPDYEYLKRVPGFPNYHFPSDHIQIMGEFTFKTRKDKKMVSEQSGSARG